MELLGKHVVSEIVKEVKAKKYFSISVDSTPDISNIDQLTLIIRYLDSESQPVERFLKFIPSPDHKAEIMKEIIVTTFSEIDIDIGDCRI